MNGWRQSVAMTGLAILGGAGLFFYDAYQLAQKPGVQPWTPAEYSSAFRMCATAGPRTRAYLSSIPDGSPVQRVAALYAILRRRWHYQESIKDGRDVLTSVDDLVGRGLVGDCKDWSVAVAGTAEALLGLRWRIITTKPTKKMPGHAYPEVLLCDRAEDAGPLLVALAHELGTAPPTATDDGAVWLTLDRDLHARPGPIEYVFYDDGKLKEAP